MRGKLIKKLDLAIKVNDFTYQEYIVLFVDNTGEDITIKYREDIQVGLLGAATIWRVRGGFNVVFLWPHEAQTLGRKLYNKLSSKKYKRLSEARRDVVEAIKQTILKMKYMWDGK
jgi:hypothetical protein